MSIINAAPRIIAGSALAGFGLSFGRDIYKTTKRNIWLILAIILLLSCLFGLFISAMWFSRNYYSPMENLIKKVGALILLAICYGVILPVISVVGAFAKETDTEIGEIIENEQWTGFWYIHESLLNPESLSGILFILQNLLIVAGIIYGLSQRRARYSAWEAEIHNDECLDEWGLRILDDENMRDSQGIRYKLENEFAYGNEIEFMAVGHRGKRGYLTYDETGKYLAWSGLTNIR